MSKNPMLSSKTQLFTALTILLLLHEGRGKAVSSSGTDQTDISDLIAVVQIHRHGQRIPVSYYTNDPYSDSSYWPAKTGELTNTGKSTHFSLGQFTRRRYDGFLPDIYNNDDFYAQTTDVDRTHMSAQSNIAGIFRPHGPEIWNEDVSWEPIPVRVIDEDILSSIPDCAIYTAEVANVLVNAEEYKVINEREAKLYSYLTEKSGSNVTSLSGVFGLFDPIIIEDQFGFELPEWTKSVYPEPLTALSGWYFGAYSYTDIQKQLTSGAWLNYITEYFTDMFEDSTSSKKYRLFSAHDFNIAAILNTLGVYDHNLPPAFASTIYVELRNKSGVATLNVWHKNNELWEQLAVRGCELDCSLEDFKANLRPWIVDTTRWAELCATSSSDLTDLATIHESPEVLQELQAIVQHANDRRHPSSPLKNVAAAAN